MPSIPTRRPLAALAFALLVAAPTAAQEVSGVWTDATTRDLGETTGIAALRGWKVRGWLETYVAANANRPDRATVDAHQDLSILRARGLTIEGRSFDVHTGSPRLNLAEVEIEKVPEKSGFGFKVDLAAGDTQNLLHDTYAATSPGSVRGWDRNVQHVSLGYLAPVGSGLRLDVGKFATHVGTEAIESIKNRNLSHSWLYTYAIPFQDTGLRLNYNFTDRLYGELYVLRGWNVTSDNNGRPSYGLSLGWNPSPAVSLNANYLGGPERNGDDRDRRDLLDLQATWTLTPTLSVAANVDLGQDARAVAPCDSHCDAHWGGIALYLRKNLGERVSPTLRVEYYADPQGFTTGVAQRVVAVTLTGDTRFFVQRPIHLLLRPELRYDRSDAPFFTDRDRFRSRRDQATAALAAVLWF